MRKDRVIDEENVHIEGSTRKPVAICGLCGAILEKDEESGEYRCPVCDGDLTEG